MTIDVVSNYMKVRKQMYELIAQDNARNAMVSERNYLERYHLRSSEDLGIRVEVGDICYIDFGQAYLYEMGYQHFGLVLAIVERKALVIPMTSNPQTYANAYDPVQNPNGKRNLFDLGDVEHLYKRSVLFLNDMKFINTARVIDVKSHLDVDGVRFRKIQMAVMGLLFSGHNDVSQTAQ